MNRIRKPEQQPLPFPSRMLDWFTGRRDLRRTAREFYGSIVTQARQPIFYADWGVADTTQGRFEMVALHVALALQRLAAEGASGQDLGRALTESFVVDMDDTMREMTFGDLAVPREVKHAVAALYDRHRTYTAAQADPDATALQQALAAQLAYLGAGERLDAAALAHYMRTTTAGLLQCPSAGVLSGQVAWPVLGRAADPAPGREGQNRP